MITLFERAVSHIFKYEGGYSYDPNDPGGRTLYGISEAAYPHLWAEAPPTKEQAKDIYYRDYWLAAKCSDLPAPIAFILFDSAVNLGVSRATKLLQKTVSVTEDGVLGPKTMAALKASDLGYVSEAFLTERALFYANLPHWPHFRRGWMRRLFDLCHYATLLEVYP